MDFRVAVALFLQIAIWGTTWAAIKVGVTDVPPWTFALDRSILVTVALVGVALAFKLPFPRDRRLLIAAAVSGAINSGISWAIIFWAEQFVPSGLVAVFGATGPIWTALLAHFFVRSDRLSPLKVGSLAIGFGGVLLLVGTADEITGGPALLAMVLLALMPLTWGVSAILMSRILSGVSPIPGVAIGSATGGIFLIPFALTELSMPVNWTVEATLALLYLAFIGSGVGLVLNFWLYRRLRPTTVMLSQLLITVEAVVIGAFALGERITPQMLVGAALVLVAIGLNAYIGRPRSQRPAEVAATPAD